MKDGNHQGTEVLDYIHPECIYTSRHFEKSETYQALHRIRLIHGTSPKRVYIFSNTPLDVSVDELLNYNRELGAENIQVIRHLKDRNVLLDSNEEFSQVFQWSLEDAKNFREKRNSGEWLRTHRSLMYWKFQTKDRKIIKAYSWHDLSEEDLINKLESRGFKIKKLLN
jgi:hypothetical protein